VASLVITVDEEKAKWARFFCAGGLLTEGMPHGLFVEGISIENLFV
jgi:hypothetical protein